MTTSLQAALDEKIANCEKRIAQYTNSLSALSVNPDTAHARDMMSKTLDSERQFLAGLREQRSVAMGGRPRRFVRQHARWPIIALGVVVFLACLIFDGISRHP